MSVPTLQFASKIALLNGSLHGLVIAEGEAKQPEHVLYCRFTKHRGFNSNSNGSQQVPGTRFCRKPASNDDSASHS